MQLNKILRYVCIGGIFLLPVIPYFVSRTMFFPFITGKNFAFRIIVEIVFASWLLLAIRDARYRPRRSILALSIGIFMAVILLADILGVNPVKSLWSNFERMEGFVGLVHLGAYFLAVGAVLGADNLWKKFFHWSFIIASIVGLYGIAQLLGWKDINQGGVRVDATLGNAIYLGVYSLIHIFLALFYLIRHQGKRIWRYVYAVFIALQLVMLIYSGARGAAVGLVVGLSVALVLTLWRGGPYRRLAVYILAGLVLLLGTLFMARNSDFVHNNDTVSRFAAMLSWDNLWQELGSRRMVWGTAWEGFQERPILGWGQENFDVVFNKYYNPKMYTQEAWFDHTHNTILDWLVAGGVVGLGAYLFIFFAVLVMLWRDKKGGLNEMDKIVLTGFLSAYFVQNLTVFDNITSYLLFFSILAFIHSSQVGEKIYLAKWWDKCGAKGAFERAGAPVVIVGLVLGLYFVNIRSVAAGRSLIQGISQQPGGLTHNLDYLDKALRLSTIGRAEVREQLMQLAIEATGIEGVEESKKMRAIDMAEREMRLQVEDNPLSARHYFFLGTFLRRVGKSDQAIEALNKAIALSPRKQLILFEAGLTYLDKGQHNESLEFFKQAYDAEPTYVQARLFYGIAAIYAGKSELAAQLYTSAYGDAAPNNDYVLRAYYDTGHHPEVLAIWQKRVEQNKDNGQIRLSLGAAYLAVGDKDGARREVAKAAELDPSLKERAEEVLRELR